MNFVSSSKVSFGLFQIIEQLFSWLKTLYTSVRQTKMEVSRQPVSTGDETVILTFLCFMTEHGVVLRESGVVLFTSGT